MGKVRIIYEANEYEAWEEVDMGKEGSLTKPLHHHPRPTAGDFWIQSNSGQNVGILQLMKSAQRAHSC